MFIRNESFKTFTKLYPIVTIILAINIVVFILTLFTIDPITNLTYMMIGSNFLLSQGEWWRLITPLFVHSGVSHILFNCFALFIFGPALERLLGKSKFIVAYLGSGILAHVALLFIESPDYQYVGASTAIFGLFGFYLYMVAIRNDLIDKANGQIVIIVLAVSLIFTFIGGNISVLGHLFGLLAGFILAPLSLYNYPVKKR